MGMDFLFLTKPGSDAIIFNTMAPDPKTLKTKALLLFKAQEVTGDEEDGDPFPTGIENEVVFMEITGKLLANLYTHCQVS